jgi:hypothetical protein
VFDMKIAASLALLLLVIAGGTVMLVTLVPDPPARTTSVAPDSVPLDSCWSGMQRPAR